jgi:hypothetical protein
VINRLNVTEKQEKPGVPKTWYLRFSFFNTIYELHSCREQLCQCVQSVCIDRCISLQETLCWKGTQHKHRGRFVTLRHRGALSTFIYTKHVFVRVRNAHAPYYHLWRARLEHIFLH